jgi:hypothetical protein
LKYIIGKNNSSGLGMGLFGSYVPNTDIFSDKVYDSVEDAEKAIIEQYQTSENERADKEWNLQSDETRAEWDKQLDDNPEMCVCINEYFVIPIAKKVEVKGIPAHRRK